MPIEYLKLAIENEDQMAAEAIARVSGGLTAAIVNAQIEERRELLKLIEAGLETPICPELSNANPASPHTVILEAQAWLASQLAYRINQIPLQNHIAFANLFQIEPRPATAAVTVLRFTVSPPADTDVSIPQGTQVATADGLYVFETTDALVIPYGTPTGDVAAERTVAGHTLLSAGVLTQLIDVPAYVTAVTNVNAIDSGTELEALEKTLERVRRFQRRGLRIVSATDLEEAILDEGLLGNGIVRAFPFVENGQFSSGVKKPGYTTVIVMTRTGDPIDDIAMIRVSTLIDQVVGNQFVYVVDPEYVEFDVTANVRLQPGVLEASALAAAEQNLRNFYAAARSQFGRGIYRSEIIAVIEGTAGVDRVMADGATIIASPAVDAELEEYQLARLVGVTLTAV